MTVRRHHFLSVLFQLAIWRADISSLPFGVLTSACATSPDDLLSFDFFEGLNSAAPPSW
ncbi:hypothetical protein HanPSC8_Chr09g0372041 [Helianthus annuus]|nr:hypothetical protein HanPSC8_Chr09g0372041 [Helianthus annuus]